MEPNKIIERAAINYESKFKAEATILKLGKESLETKLYEFSTNKSKFEFLNILRNNIYKKLEDHLKNCQTPNCGTESNLSTAVFIIDEQIESMQEYYIPRYVSPDEFTPNEKSQVNRQLDEVVKLLKAGGMADELIYNEIDELREQVHNLGKKSWFQLAKQKLIDLGLKNLLTPEIIKSTFNTIAHDFGFTFKFLEN